MDEPRWLGRNVMAIDRQHNKVIFICDECDDDFETGETNFFEALNRVKEEGWIVKRNDDDTEWLHICASCTA